MKNNKAPERHEFLRHPLGQFANPKNDIGKCWRVINQAAREYEPLTQVFHTFCYGCGHMDQMRGHTVRMAPCAGPMKTIEYVRADLTPDEPLVIEEFKTAEEFFDAYNVEAVAAQIAARFTMGGDYGSALQRDIAKAVTTAVDRQREADAQIAERLYADKVFDVDGILRAEIAAAIRNGK